MSRWATGYYFCRQATFDEGYDGCLLFRNAEGLTGANTDRYLTGRRNGIDQTPVSRAYVREHVRCAEHNTAPEVLFQWSAWARRRHNARRGKWEYDRAGGWIRRRLPARTLRTTWKHPLPNAFARV